MPAYFEQGFMVREPAWHGLGTVLDDYPGREEAMRLAGHDFVIVEKPLFLPGPEIVGGPQDGAVTPGPKVEGFKALMREDNEAVMHIVNNDYCVIQNDVAWDVVDAIVGEGALYETGITLQGGAVCSVLAWLDEPVTIPGDDSTILPFLNVAWSHNASRALTVRPTNVRTVCSNTQSAAEAQGRRLDREFTFRHTKNVMDRIEEAKLAVQGTRDAHDEYITLAKELADLPVTDDQRTLFAANFIPMPEEALISDRVKGNVEEARAKLLGLFDGPTIPDAHRNTGYGLHLAGTEYLDHLRGYRSEETRFGRSLLRDEPAKRKMTSLIREVAKA